MHRNVTGNQQLTCSSFFFLSLLRLFARDAVSAVLGCVGGSQESPTREEERSHLHLAWLHRRQPPLPVIELKGDVLSYGSVGHCLGQQADLGIGDDWEGKGGVERGDFVFHLLQGPSRALSRSFGSDGRK